MPARSARNTRISTLAVGLLLLLAPTARADEADRFQIRVSADLLAAQALLSGQSLEPQYMPDGSFSLSEEDQKRVQDRLKGLSLISADEFAKKTETQNFEIIREESTTYQRMDGALKKRDIWPTDHAELIYGIASLPSQIEVKNSAGEAIPAWWLSLDALEAAVHPADGGNLDYTGAILPGKLKDCLANWDQLSPAQRQQLGAIARRNDYGQIFQRTLRHRAHSRLLGIQRAFRNLQRDLGIQAHETGSAGDGLIILGLTKEGDAPLQYSVRTSQFPQGRWIPEGENVAGIRPLSADLTTLRAKADYLQTRWDLKVGPKLNPTEADVSRIESYLQLHGFGFIVDRLPQSANIDNFFAEYRRACSGLSEIAALAGSQLGPDADEAAHEQLLSNPYMDAAISEELITLLTSAESFRQAILARTGEP